MNVVTQARNAEKVALRIQRRMWWLQTLFWSVLTLSVVAAVAIAGYRFVQSRRNTRIVSKPAPALPDDVIVVSEDPD